ncbi:MAG: galactokinase [Clostridia bacterium]|nr:galactokinase [Clostridia bacterium]
MSTTIQLFDLYPGTSESERTERFSSLSRKFHTLFPACGEGRFFSSPGRTEIAGNHTDHNHGKVLAGSVNLDILALAAPRSDGKILLQSDDMPLCEIELDRDLNPGPDKNGTSLGLIAGVCRARVNRGAPVGGFCAVATSNVPQGSGVSSSAAFENLIGLIENVFYGKGEDSPVRIAKDSQYAENVFFGKPCGLMDQIACAQGGVVAIDFEQADSPVLAPVERAFSDWDYDLCITGTGGTHADLTDEYASIPADMKKIASFFEKDFLRQVDPALFYARLSEVRSACGDRALMRAMHFFRENERVERMCRALSRSDYDEFLKIVLESGSSSFCRLQNIVPSGAGEEQPVALALALSEEVLGRAPRPAAWRVHGGGFAGTILAFVPREYTPVYRREMDALFGTGSCRALQIRPYGAVQIGGESDVLA